MKKALVLMFVLVLGLAAFAGPFVGFDYTIDNDDAMLCIGIREGPLTLKLSVCDLFAVQTGPTIGFLGKYCVEYSYWDNEFQYWINEIDILTDYSILTVGGMGLLWRGTIHVGTLVEMLAEPPLAVSASTFDVYGEVSFEYIYEERQLIPTGSVGFYWEL